MGFRHDYTGFRHDYMGFRHAYIGFPHVYIGDRAEPTAQGAIFMENTEAVCTIGPRVSAANESAPGRISLRGWYLSTWRVTLHIRDGTVSLAPELL